MAMQNQAMRGVVRGEADRYAIAHDDTDVKALHLAAEASKDGRAVFELNRVIAAAGSFGDAAFESNQIIFRHSGLISLVVSKLQTANCVEKSKKTGCLGKSQAPRKRNSAA